MFDSMNYPHNVTYPTSKPESARETTIVFDLLGDLPNVVWKQYCESIAIIEAQRIAEIETLEGNWAEMLIA